MQIIAFTFLVFDYIFVCGVLSCATLLSYVVLQYWICIGQDNKTLTNTYLLSMVQIVIKIQGKITGTY